MKIKPAVNKLEWIDALKAFAIIAILLNHFVESFRSYPWFSNPSSTWPDLATRLANIFPQDGSFSFRLLQFFGWLGDMGPGVFILLSGLTLTLSALSRPVTLISFYKKRLLRIFPLYMLIHAIVLAAAILIFKWEIDPFSVNTILSFLGLRFNESLFFFINPSWWFIWLIIQFYLVFPFLLKLLNKKGIILFGLISLIITLLSRYVGISGIYKGEMFYWMTGMFGGTRLFEFAAGMIFGKLLLERSEKVNRILKAPGKILWVSVLIYLLGFSASWTYAGSLISNILISIGLSGVFYGLYQLLFSRFKGLKEPLLWIGKNSFSVFLLHQPFMMYVSGVFGGSMKVLALGIVVLASFATGAIIEKVLAEVLKSPQNFMSSITNKFKGKQIRWAVYFLIVLTSLCSFSFLFVSAGWMYKLTKLLLLFVLLLSTLLFFMRKQEAHGGTNRFIYIVFFINLLFIYITGNWYSVYWILVLISGMAFSVSYRFKNGWLFSLVFVMALTFLTNYYLKSMKPIEINKWGEYTALQKDEQTVYSLIPNKSTHLRYNNYDYVLSTNSLGFTSPEYELSDKDWNTKRIFLSGDAFSMPEGLEYNKSYAHLLEEKLKAGFPDNEIQVFNAAVTGYGPNEEALQLKKFMGKVQPDLVILQFFVNEYEEIHLSPEERLHDIGFRKKTSLREKLFLSSQLPVQYTLLLKKWLGIPDNAYRYLKSMAYLYERNADLYSEASVKLMKDKLKEISDLCIFNKAELLLMYVPSQLEVLKPEQIDYYPYHIDLSDTVNYSFDLPREITKRICEENGIFFTDITNRLKQNKFQPVYFSKSWHWNEEGHKEASDFLYEQIKNNQLLK